MEAKDQGQRGATEANQGDKSQTPHRLSGLAAASYAVGMESHRQMLHDHAQRVRDSHRAQMEVAGFTAGGDPEDEMGDIIVTGDINVTDPRSLDGLLRRDGIGKMNAGGGPSDEPAVSGSSEPSRPTEVRPRQESEHGGRQADPNRGPQWWQVALMAGSLAAGSAGLTYGLTKQGGSGSSPSQVDIDRYFFDILPEEH